MTEDSRYSEQRALLLEMAEAWIELIEQIGGEPTAPVKAQHR